MGTRDDDDERLTPTDGPVGHRNER
jgi:hypothetical protein